MNNDTRTEQDIINEAVAEAKQRLKLYNRIAELMKAKNAIDAELSQLELERSKNNAFIPNWQSALQEKIDAQLRKEDK
tara:strand:+ start:763 stop:996 length:234 start_codon:yes stop_codon:yes gene_type:complete